MPRLEWPLRAIHSLANPSGLQAARWERDHAAACNRTHHPHMYRNPGGILPPRPAPEPP